MTQTSATKKDYPVNWYRFLYVAFVLFGAYFLFASKGLSSAVSNFGIALAFDPFDQKMSWGKRPVWQRAWLLVHVSLVLMGVGYMLFLK